MLGSPAYMAPERAADGPVGPEADLWSLGATLYSAVEGRSPYARPSALATLAALATENRPAPPHAGPLGRCWTGLLRREPQARLTAAQTRTLLSRVAAPPRPVPGPPAGAPPPPTVRSA